MKTYKPHPLSGIFPLMPPDQYEAFKKDVEQNGIQSCGLLFEGMILDGRNRYRVCQELGIRLDFEEVELGEPEDVAKFDPLAYVLSHNLHRRHLDESQRAMVAGRLATLKNGQHGKSKATQICVASEAAKLLKVSNRSVVAAKHVIDKGSNDLVEAVESREVKVSAAEKLCKTHPDKKEQSRIVKGGKEAVKAAVKAATSTPKAAIQLPDDPSQSDVVEVAAWVDLHDQRSIYEKLSDLWNSDSAAEDATGCARFRAELLGE